MRLAPFLATIWLLVSTDAPAFECSGVNLPSSQVICSDPELVRIADERQALFSELWERLSPDQQSTLKIDQNRWVREYATACGVPPNVPPQLPATSQVVQCFKRAGLERTAYLRSYLIGLPSGAPASSVSRDTTTSTQGRIGPSFKCAPGQDPLAQVICSDSNCLR